MEGRSRCRVLRVRAQPLVSRCPGFLPRLPCRQGFPTHGSHWAAVSMAWESRTQMVQAIIPACGRVRPRGDAEATRKEDGMLVEDRYTRFVAERVKSPPLTSGDTLYWDGMGVASQGVGLTPGLEPVAHVAWLAPPLVIGYRASPVVPTRPPGLLLVPPAPAIDWAKEAAALSVYLNPCLLLTPVHDLLPGATGELIWVPWQHTTAFPLAVHPALLVHTATAP